MHVLWEPVHAGYMHRWFLHACQCQVARASTGWSECHQAACQHALRVAAPTQPWMRHISTTFLVLMRLLTEQGLCYDAISGVHVLGGGSVKGTFDTQCFLAVHVAGPDLRF